MILSKEHKPYIINSIALDFYIVRWLHLSTGKKRRWLTGLSILLNVGLLAYFKYANFLIDNFNTVLTSFEIENVSWTEVALPIGDRETFRKPPGIGEAASPVWVF